MTTLIILSILFILLSYYLYVQIYFVNTANKIYDKCNKYPYTFTILNKNDKVSKAVLFGCDKYQYSKNHGSDEGIEIVSFPFNDYKDILLQSKNMPFNLSNFRLVCSNVNQITQRIEFFCQDVDGSSLMYPIMPVFKNTDFNQCIINVDDIKFKIDGKSSFELTLLPEQTLQITISPDDKIEKATLFFQIKKDIINFYNGIKYYKKRKQILLQKIKSTVA